ncbi:hypothetical protein [Streptomonospora salina]|uniref:ACT domain-containing protein n=1 Tax=Streptomonospora salina TaxID=104205 RepID=A0A841EA62_9ACTN|nr:hypothetical protein [Streptomonospora salina]MBB5996341.1 hypothetical protein [Streptomonospora salina]
MGDDMRTDPNTRPKARRLPAPRGFFGQELVDVGGLLLAAGAAHLLVLSLGHSDLGGRLLAAAGAVLLAASTLHRWRAHRTGARTYGRGPAAPHGRASPAPEPAAGGRERLWRVRVAVDDVPGGLAALTAQMARHGVDIRLLQVHPAGEEAVDELYVSAPAGIGADALGEAAARAGGRRPAVEPADVHDLTDTATRALSLLAGLAAGRTRLEEALGAVSGAGTVEHRPAPPPGLEAEDVRGTRISLPDPGGGVLVLNRAVAFTPVEFARCRALVQAAGCLRERLHLPADAARAGEAGPED